MSMKNFFENLIKWLTFFFEWLKGQQPEVVTNSGTTETDEPSTVTVTGETTEVETGSTVETGETDPTFGYPPKKEYKKVFLLDNGHASTTPGKRSPLDENGERFFEYEFNRAIVKRIATKLDELGVPYEIITPEVDYDVPLLERCNRANKFCKKYGTNNCVFISVHANAAGHGDKWMNGQGWVCYTSEGTTKSDTYAEMFMREAEKCLAPYGRKIRRRGNGKLSYEANFTVLAKTLCPAVLTENLFFDNREEMEFLRSEEGRDVIAQIHVNTILQIEELDD